MKKKVHRNWNTSKKALDARASVSDDSEAPSIRNRSPFNGKTLKNNDVSDWFDTLDKFSNLHNYSFKRAKTRVDNNCHRVSFNREGVLKSRSPSRERSSSAREQNELKRKKPSSSRQLPKLTLSSFDETPKSCRSGRICSEQRFTIAIYLTQRK